MDKDKFHQRNVFVFLCRVCVCVRVQKNKSITATVAFIMLRVTGLVNKTTNIFFPPRSPCQASLPVRQVSQGSLAIELMSLSARASSDAQGVGYEQQPQARREVLCPAQKPGTHPKIPFPTQTGAEPSERTTSAAGNGDQSAGLLQWSIHASHHNAAIRVVDIAPMPNRLQRGVEAEGFLGRREAVRRWATNNIR